MVFFKQVRNLTILFIVFGLWSTWKTKKSKWIRAYSICSVYQELVIVSAVIYSYDIFNNDTLSATVENWMYLVISLTHLVVLIESLVTHDSQVKLIKKFSIVDHLISTKLKVKIPYRREKCETFARNFIFIWIIISLKGTISGYLHYLNKIFVAWYPALFSIWIMCLRTIQVTLYVYLLRCRLKLINNELKCIQSEFGEETSNDGNTRRVTFTRYSVYNRIKTLKNIYSQLFDCCELVNETFGWSLLAIITQCFVDFTFNCYCSFLYLEKAEVDVSNLLICISLLLPVALLSSGLTFFCSTCYQQVRFSFLDANSTKCSK